MLLFPFTNKDGFDLVECVLLPEIPIWANKAEEGALLNRHLLVVMLLLCGGRGKGDAIDYTQYKSQYPSDALSVNVMSGGAVLIEAARLLFFVQTYTIWYLSSWFNIYDVCMLPLSSTMLTN